MSDQPEAPLRWEQPEWLESAYAWIATQLEQLGLDASGEPEQVHVRWWSTVIRVPTTAGDLYFKAAAAAHAFEPALVSMLADLQPGRLPDIAAADPTRGWMLMRDGGELLRDEIRTPADLSRWEEVLARYAELQLATAPYADELLALGVPDLSIGGLATSFRKLLDDEDAILLHRPNGLTAAERDRLRDYVPTISSAVDLLAAQGIPATIQHDDLHDGNVFVRDGRYQIVDWGDSSVSHPFHTLVVVFRAIVYRFDPDVEPGGPEILRLRDAYLEPFAQYGDHGSLARAVDLAHLTGTLARALAWHRFVTLRPPTFRGEDVEAVPYGLKRLLNLGPLGSWDLDAEEPSEPGAEPPEPVVPAGEEVLDVAGREDEQAPGRLGDDLRVGPPDEPAADIAEDVAGDESHTAPAGSPDDDLSREDE